MNIGKPLRRIGSMVSLRNIVKAITNPKKALALAGIYLTKDRNEEKSVNKIIKKFFPDQKEEISKILRDLYKTPAYNTRFDSGRAGTVDAITLYISTRMLKPETVIETGVASGRSSSFILQALHDNNHGKLYSIELPLYYPISKKSDDPSLLIDVEGNIEATGFIPEGKEPGWLIPNFLRPRWNLILGKSEIELPKLVRHLKQVDIFYHDSDHTYRNMLFEYETVWPYIRRGGIIISDDIHWNKAFDDFTAKFQNRGIVLHKDNSIGLAKKI